MLEAGADPNARTIYDITPLHTAATFNANLAILLAVLKAGADPNARDKDGFTPLHSAARTNKNPAVIAALLEAGAAPNTQDKTGKSPWDYAKENEALKDSDVYRLLHEGRF